LTLQSKLCCSECWARKGEPEEDYVTGSSSISMRTGVLSDRTIVPSTTAPALFPRIWFGQADNIVIVDPTQLPLAMRETLGDDMCGNFEVVATTNGTLYARKTLSFHHIRDRRARQRIFINRMRIIGGLDKHHHIVQIFAAYVSPTEIGVLLFPMADHGNLSRFLSDCWATPQGTDASKWMRKAIQQ
jgi:hypothetical protein